ncbi:hypothetical protein BX281_4168 [Streptomyces sp. Ag82_O1-15]|nr:hypothetical protein BX281_4168 [Streptomyces sp. Ag82_O1-15]
MASTVMPCVNIADRKRSFAIPTPGDVWGRA